MKKSSIDIVGRSLFLHGSQQNLGGYQLRSSLFLVGNFLVFQSISSHFYGCFGRGICACVFEDYFLFYKAVRLGNIYSALHKILSLILS